MDLFSRECPNCRKQNPHSAEFCGQCSTPLRSGRIKCGVCGTWNHGDANFCQKCRAPLSANATPQLRDQQWVCGEQDFAARIDIKDLPGMFRRGITIKMGTNAILVEDGANKGELGPGTYTLDSLDERLSNWILGVPAKKRSVLLVNILPSEMEFNLGGVFTKDPIRIGLTVHVQAQVDQTARFLVRTLADRERYSREDLRQYLYPEITQVVEKWLSEHTVQELAEDLTLKEKLELALDEALKPTLNGLGLKFIAVRTLDINLEHLDKIKGIRSKYALQVTEAEAETQGLKGWVAAKKELDLQKIIEETARVEDEEKRAELYHRMRQAVMAGKMDEVRSEAEFEAFLDDLDRQKLLREKERADLLQSWKEEADNHQLARAHLLAKLEVERTYELEAADLNLRQDLSRKEVEFEIEIARKRAEMEYSVRALEWEYRLKEEREKHKLEVEQTSTDIEIAIDALRKMKSVKREDKENELNLQLVEQRAKNEMEIQRMRMQHEFDIQRMDRLATLSVEAIIATSGPEQGRILADLKRTELLKGMSEEQILALAAERSPDVARALEEKFRSMASGKASSREQEMYEKLLAERELRTRGESEAWRESNQAVRGMADKALDSTKDVATAFAMGPGRTPVIITRSDGMTVGAPTAMYNQSDGKTGSKSCPKCGQFVESDAHYCRYCGNKFEGMK